MNESLEHKISGSPYPGRGLVVGLSEDGRRYHQLYWIMGRSENSRNRIFQHEAGRLWTEAADPKKLSDPSLIIYDAMLENDRRFWVGNGDQVSTLAESHRTGGHFVQALLKRQREPDAPNYTPRISALLDLGAAGVTLWLSIIKANRWDPEASERQFYCWDRLRAGVGVGITTYEGDGNPLPSYRGEPRDYPLLGSDTQILKALWAKLHPDNRVSAAIKTITREGSSCLQCINRFERV